MILNIQYDENCNDIFFVIIYYHFDVKLPSLGFLKIFQKYFHSTIQ